MAPVFDSITCNDNFGRFFDFANFVRFENNDDVKIRVIGDSPRDPSPTAVEFYVTLEPRQHYTTRIAYDGIHWIRLETYPDEELIPWLNVTLNVD